MSKALPKATEQVLIKVTPDQRKWFNEVMADLKVTQASIILDALAAQHPSFPTARRDVGQRDDPGDNQKRWSFLSVKKGYRVTVFQEMDGYRVYARGVDYQQSHSQVVALLKNNVGNVSDQTLQDFGIDRNHLFKKSE